MGQFRRSMVDERATNRADLDPQGQLLEGRVDNVARISVACNGEASRVGRTLRRIEGMNVSSLEPGVQGAESPRADYLADPSTNPIDRSIGLYDVP